MNIGIRGWQDTGKTALGIGSILDCLWYHGYSPGEVIANVVLKIPGAHCINNNQMRQFLKTLVIKEIRHKLILVDEADRVLPARFWHDREQTDALMDIVQDEKLFNRLYWTAHKGKGVDIALRQGTQIEVETYFYDKAHDEIPFTVYDELDGVVFDDVMLDVSKNIFPIYDRWAVIK